MEGLLTLVPQCMATTDESNKEPKPRVYETVRQLASKALVLLGLCNVVEYQAMSVPKEIADLYKTFRVHGGPLWMMLHTTITERIYEVSFRTSPRSPSV